MKVNRTNIFIIISSLALLIVLIIQVNWIFQTAQIKEEMFNEKANLVLARTTDALFADQETCKKIETSLEKKTSIHDIFLGKNEIRKIDSLLMQSMKFYGFHVDYSFAVIKSNRLEQNESTFKDASYQAPVTCAQIGLEEAVNKNGFELKLNFPKKNEFIKAEVKTLFITSVILIVIVLIMFWRTTLSLLREKELSEHTTEFLNNMTHEFKTPLTNIALAGKMIIKDQNNREASLPDRQDKITHYSGIILKENEKLKLQVEQVLSMSALERGEIPFQRTKLNLHELIKESLKGISLQIEDRQGNIKLNLSAEKFMVNGDKTHLSNALSNLIDNAIKYSKEAPELFIKTKNIDQKIIVTIEDKGIGIEKEYQKKVFDKFFRVPTGDIHDVKGFGLGLAYIKKIVELHEGTIEVQSEKGMGTTFIITLPNA
jgi:two-component system, OmpR family, phosphate regulon sensor histidine kinase PhoR